MLNFKILILFKFIMENNEFNKIKLFNSIFKKYDGKSITNQTCEICFETKNLLICENCKNYYHMHCLRINIIPIKFNCPECKENFKIKDYNNFESPSIFESKTALNKLNSFEFKQRSFKKDNITTYSTKKGKRERELSQISFSQSLSFKDNIDKEIENSYFNREKVLI